MWCEEATRPGLRQTGFKPIPTCKCALELWLHLSKPPLPHPGLGVLEVEQCPWAENLHHCLSRSWGHSTGLPLPAQPLFSSAQGKSRVTDHSKNVAMRLEVKVLNPFPISQMGTLRSGEELWFIQGHNNVPLVVPRQESGPPDSAFLPWFLHLCTGLGRGAVSVLCELLRTGLGGWRSLGTPRIRHQPPTDYPGVCTCQPVSRPPLSQSWEMMGDGIKVDSEGKGDGPGTQAKAREGPSFLCNMGLGQADTQTHPWRQRPSDRLTQQHMDHGHVCGNTISIIPRSGATANQRGSEVPFFFQSYRFGFFFFFPTF